MFQTKLFRKQEVKGSSFSVVLKSDQSLERLFRLQMFDEGKTVKFVK